MPNILAEGQRVPTDGNLADFAFRDIALRPFGVYLHIPFCRTRCGYCDFNTYTFKELTGLNPADYITAALCEIKLARRILPVETPKITTVFIGGGTPTMLTPEELKKLIEQLDCEFGLDDNAEISCEANPETLNTEILQGLLNAGITRLSMGMQSGVDRVLATLERIHTPGQAITMAKKAKELGFAHVSLDLIYGTPGESNDDWLTSLELATSANPDHISAYSLIVEPGTRMAMKIKRGELSMPDEDELADKYLATEKFLLNHGFSNYEVSNWALSKSARCQHNMNYWKSDNWWGIGPGAHSHIGSLRWWNIKHPRSYFEVLQRGESPRQGQEILTAEQQRVERVLLELRLSQGLPINVLTTTEQQRIPELIRRGLLFLQEDKCVLTLAGRLLADAIVRDLLD